MLRSFQKQTFWLILLSAFVLLALATTGLAAPPPDTSPTPTHPAGIQPNTALSAPLFLPVIRTGSAPPPIDELTAEERMTAIDAIGAQLNQIIDPTIPIEQRNPVQELQTLAEELVSAPHVLTVLYYPDTLTVQVILEDGFSILINNNRPSSAELDSLSTVFNRFAPLPVSDNPVFGLGALAPGTDTLPGSKRMVAKAFDGGGAVAAAVGSLLAQRGYANKGLGTSVEDMKQYTDLGALYLDTHGTAWQRILGISTDGNGKKHPVMGKASYALQTSSQVSTQALQTTYKADIDAGRLTVQFVEVGGSHQAKLSITESFISKYWQFDNAIVMLHSCFGGAGPFTSAGQCFGSCDNQTQGVFDPRPIRGAILNAGANVFVSFDNYTNTDVARDNILFFFDRMTGANEEQPTNPPTRPFPFVNVWEEMSRRNLLTFHKPAWIGPLGIGFGGNDVNMTYSARNSDAGLTPGIRYVEVVDDADQEKGKLEIVGTFSDKQGKVTLGDVTADILSWSKTKIEVATAFGGLGGRGDLVVRAPDPVYSNEVPITEWRGMLTVTLDPNRGSLQARSIMDVRFRADIHEFRNEIYDSPTPRPVDTYFSGISEGRTEGSGRWSDDGVVETWEGGRPMELFGKQAIDAFAGGGYMGQGQGLERANAGEGGRFGGIVTLDPEAKTARLCFILIGQYNKRITADGHTQILPSNLIIPGPPGLDDGRRGLLSCYDLSINADGSLAADTRSITIENAEFRVEWTTFTPEATPSDDTPG